MPTALFTHHMSPCCRGMCHEYVLYLVPDDGRDLRAQWFFFAVAGFERAPTQYTFHVATLFKRTCMFRRSGALPVMCTLNLSHEYGVVGLERAIAEAVEVGGRASGARSSAEGSLRTSRTDEALKRQTAASESTGVVEKSADGCVGTCSCCRVLSSASPPCVALRFRTVASNVPLGGTSAPT